jgi:outer membrane protein TolC
MVIACIAGLALGAGMLGGCTSPLQNKVDRDLRRSVRESAERELVEAKDSPEPVRLEREDRVRNLGIKPEVMGELEAMGGVQSYAGKDLPLGVNLFGKQQKVVRVTLERAISTAIKNNLNVEFARLGPAINQQQLIAAEAAFDWVLFANPQVSLTNQPRSASAFGSPPNPATTTTEDKRDIYEVTAGVRKPLIAGGQLSLQTEVQYSESRTRNLFVSPDPTRETNFVIQLDQPLLRGFGSDTALAQVRLARNAELDEIQQLKATLLTNVNDVEGSYWALARARIDLLILQRLQERGEEVLNVLRNREGFDANPAAVSDAAAAVEQRRTDVIRGQRVLREASDRLKLLMNDPDLPVGSETLVLAADMPVDQSLEFSLVDAVNNAIANRPEIQRAVLSMDNTSIRQGVADNGRLPRLDLRALTRFSGLSDGYGKAYEQLQDADFVDYQIGLTFEQPLGNRGAEAVFKQRRLERVQAVVAYRNTIDGVVNEVKSALRDIQTNYALIEQTRTQRIAAAEAVRTLLVQEQNIQGMNPEFLNLKLDRQQRLAAAEQSEIQSLIEFNTAIARLYTATGTALERNRIQFTVPSVKQDRRTSELFPDYPLEPRRATREEIRRR